MREPARYDAIGRGYARYRREDPELMTRIERALGDARTVVNVGAGTGTYEPPRRAVFAVEPSAVMAAQRPAERPALRGWAHALPLRDDSVDAAITVLSLHHWDDAQAAGVRELCRVARSRVVIVTVDSDVGNRWWLPADYFPEVAELDARIFPAPETICAWLGGAEVQVVPVSHDTPDWTMMSFWAHPGRVLDPAARAVTSGFARQPARVVERVVHNLGADLDSGVWDARHGWLRRLEAYDVGLRLIVAELD